MCTQVEALDENNWEKLIHETKCFQQTSYLPLILCLDGKSIVVWINGLHAVHAGIKGCVDLSTSVGTVKEHSYPVQIE